MDKTRNKIEDLEHVAETSATHFAANATGDGKIIIQASHILAKGLFAIAYAIASLGKDSS